MSEDTYEAYLEGKIAWCAASDYNQHIIMKAAYTDALRKYRELKKESKNDTQA